jgi:glucoamylase
VSLYTLAISIAALLAAADMAEERQQPGVATYCRKTADYLQERIDLWTYVRTASGLGYYTDTGVPGRKASGPASPEVLALVRFGLRRADDPRILDTLKVVDNELKQESPVGPCWQTKVGDDKAWLLYTAERALYELSAGRKADAMALLKTIEAHAPFGLFPEKVGCREPWEPIGSDLPSIRTHAEYIRLCCALKEGKSPDVPRFTTERYVLKNTTAPFDRWRIDAPCHTVAPGKKLRIEVPESALIHWSDDGWVTKQHTLTRDTHLGVHVAELSPRMTHARQVTFTFFWLSPERWENKNYVVPLT